MLKIPHVLYNLDYPVTNSLTPIRDYNNDFFHKDDDKLPKATNTNYIVSSNNSRKSLQHQKKRGSNRSSKYVDDESEIDLLCFQQDITSSLMNASYTAIFYKAVRELYESEIEYTKIMGLSNSVYRNNMNTTFSNMLLTEGSNEEILLFGNIETITLISKLFTSNISAMLLNLSGMKEVNEEFWEKIIYSEHLQGLLSSKFNISEAFNIHFLRIKSVYLSYSLAHEKQVKLFEFLKAANLDAFNKWYMASLKAAGLHHLEDILQRPLKRLEGWVSILKRLCQYSDEVLSATLSEELHKTLECYVDFLKLVQEQTSEYKTNKIYDYSLTPVEIIENYTVEDGLPNSWASDTSTVSKAASFTQGSCSIRSYSESSSTYSEEKWQKPLVMKREITDDKRNIDDTETMTHMHDDINQFNQLHKQLKKLRDKLEEKDFLIIINTQVRFLKLWNDTLASEDKLPSETNFILTGYEEYMTKLSGMREQIMLLKLTTFEPFVIAPLIIMLDYCKVIQRKLKDQKILKREQILHIKEKRTNVHDVKREIILRHFKETEKSLATELPVFNKLAFDISKQLVSNYTYFLAKYFLICSGSRTDELSNMNIVRSFSAARHRVKQSVRNNWQFPTDPEASRIIRKLFEL